LRGELWRTVLDCATHNFLSLRYVMLMIGLYLHYGPFATAVIAHHEQQIELIDRGEWKDPGSEQTASRQLVSPDQ